MRQRYFAAALELPVVALVALTACAGQDTSAIDLVQQPGTLSSAIIGTTTYPVQYAYDAAGRLVGVYDPNGNGAQYTYDAVGNLLSITSSLTSSLGIFGFTPGSGVVGSYVTIMGNGFSTAPTGTVVRFNGTAAAISVASTRELRVQVPAGATTGKITVQVAGVTAESPASFTVIPAPVTITSISPTVGDGNTIITVSGAGFDPNVTDNSARIGNVSAQVVSATTTRVTIGVPPTGASGPVTIMTSRGSATSAQEFVMAPRDIAASTVGTTYRMSIDGPDAVVTVAAGRVGLIVFDAEAGDALGLGMTATTFSGTGGATVSLYDTNGDLTLPSTNKGSVGLSQPKGWILPRVPTRGTYTLAIRPDAGVAVSSMTLTLTRALCGALTPGVVATVTTTRPGQFARCTFQPESTVNYTLVAKNLTFPVRINIASFDPSGIALREETKLQGEPYLLPFLRVRVPTSGDPYEVQVAPVDVTKVGQASVALLPDVLSPITVDGPASTLNVGAGQGGAFVFSGQIGDRLGMGVSTWTTSPANERPPAEAGGFPLAHWKCAFRLKPAQANRLKAAG